MTTHTNQQTTTQMRESILATAAGGMAIALSSVLSLIRVFEMPQGGSVTAASMLPILFVALALGPAWGMGIGAVYGLLQFIIQPYAAHWASVVLDYPLAFGLLGLAGFMARPIQERMAERNLLHRLSAIRWTNILLAVVVGMAGRTLAHVISGVVFYGSYAAEAGQNPWIYSLTYNLSYMIPEAIITLIVLVPLAVVFRKKG
ncbi:MAG: energy-coupled thiamine transporter ThiT [Eubacteriales bacterium]|nr:energy-coupled thiamine transporter ThiT [Eubacteriales bacterium]